MKAQHDQMLALAAARDLGELVNHDVGLGLDHHGPEATRIQCVADHRLQADGAQRLGALWRPASFPTTACPAWSSTWTNGRPMTPLAPATKTLNDTPPRLARPGCRAPEAQPAGREIRYFPSPPSGWARIVVMKRSPNSLHFHSPTPLTARKVPGVVGLWRAISRREASLKIT